MEKRLDRIEERVDEVKDEVSELKVDFRVHSELMKEHIVGDNKIIENMTPLLETLPLLKDIVADYQLDKRSAIQKAENRKVIFDRLKIISILVGIIVPISAYFLS